MRTSQGDNGVAFGIIGGMFVGVLIFAVTQNPIWIALGPSFGLPIGILVANMRKPS